MPRRSRQDPALTPIERAKAIALRVLAFHARTEAQLRARLARDGLEGEAGEVIAWLQRLGYLDDAAYARGRARELLGAGGAGPRKAEERLRAAGIAPTDARRAVRAALADQAEEVGRGGDPELALAREALARKLRGANLAALDPRGRARLARFLLGRGFSPAVVGRTLGEDLPDDGA